MTIEILESKIQELMDYYGRHSDYEFDFGNALKETTILRYKDKIADYLEPAFGVFLFAGRYPVVAISREEAKQIICIAGDPEIFPLKQL